jgi:hypothetical protein
MVRLDQLLTELLPYLPGLAILLLLAATLKILGVLAARRKRLADYKRTILPQFLMVAVAAGGVLLIVLAWPLRDATRGQVLGLLGVVFTGIIALVIDDLRDQCSRRADAAVDPELQIRRFLSRLEKASGASPRGASFIPKSRPRSAI